MILIFWSFSSTAQYVSEINGGEWSDNNTWIGNAPPYTNIANSVTINGYVISNQSLSLSSTGSDKNTFIVNDTLVVYGNLSLGLDDDFTVSAGAVIVIFGDFSAVNKVNIENGGYFVVLGNFTMTGGTGTTYNNSGTGQTYITGTVNVSGVGGDGIPALECDPDFDVGCGYGDAGDIINDPIWDFINEIDNSLVCNITISGIVSDVTTAGGSDGSIDLTISGVTSPSIEWSNGALTEDISGLVVGNYSVVVSKGYCITTSSFAINGFCSSVPTTGSIFHVSNSFSL